MALDFSPTCDISKIADGDSDDDDGGGLFQVRALLDDAEPVALHGHCLRATISTHNGEIFARKPWPGEKTGAGAKLANVALVSPSRVTFLR